MKMDVSQSPYGTCHDLRGTGRKYIGDITGPTPTYMFTEGTYRDRDWGHSQSVEETAHPRAGARAQQRKQVAASSVFTAV